MPMFFLREILVGAVLDLIGLNAECADTVNTIGHNYSNQRVETILLLHEL